jgi:transposase
MTEVFTVMACGANSHQTFDGAERRPYESSVAQAVPPPEVSAFCDGVDAPVRHRMCQNEVCLTSQAKEASVEEAIIIGLDLAKTVFQVHGATREGRTVFNRRLLRSEVMNFLGGRPRCIVAMEACGGAHYWAREIRKLGHEVRLLPAIYVKPYVKRNKTDAADAEAICEAALRQNMRFVPVKSEESQAQATLLRTRELLERQRTQTINALRGLMNEFGHVAPAGRRQVARLTDLIDDEAAGLPEAARIGLRVLAQTIGHLDEQLAGLDKQLRNLAKQDDEARRLMTVPGVGPMSAAAFMALMPDPAHFKCGRAFSAWLGFTPTEHSSGGKQRLGRVSKRGEKSLRRLLLLGATAVVRQALRRPPNPKSWLGRMLATKPRMVVITALANKTARIIWAIRAKGGVYRDQQASAVAA